MEKNIFNGDLDSLSTRQQEFVCEVLEKRGFENGQITIEIVGKPGDNYMANVKRIIAQNTDGEIFKMIAKVAPRNEIARKRTNIDRVFKNEATMYEEILPRLLEVQIAAGIPKEELFRFVQCYGILLEPPHEFILLEDLQLSNFVILDRFKPLTDNVVRMILKNFAILHSLSFVLKKEDPETFSTYKTKLIDIFGSMDGEDEFAMYANSLENDAIEVLKSEKYKMAARNTISKLFEDCRETNKDQADMNQSVVIQGDGWTNNVMFRLENKEPVECIMIDYQLSKVSNPACDILYMIFNCTDHETRRKHYYEWIQYYHLELDKSLSKFGMKADTVYPKEDLDADLKKYSKLFLAISIMLSAILIRKPEDAAKVKQAMESSESPENIAQTFQTTNLDTESVALFRSRIEGLIDSYRKFGYINDII